MVVISVYTYGVKVIKKIPVGKWFSLGGSMEPPLCTNGSAWYLMQLILNGRICLSQLVQEHACSIPLTGMISNGF